MENLYSIRKIELATTHSLGENISETPNVLIDQEFSSEKLHEIAENQFSQAKDMFHGKEVYITYDPTLIRCNQKGDKMWWHIKVYSDDIMNIRTAMGLGAPFHSLHMTIGLVNPKFIDHSEWIVKTCEKLGMYLPIR